MFVELAAAIYALNVGGCDDKQEPAPGCATRDAIHVSNQSEVARQIVELRGLLSDSCDV